MLQLSWHWGDNQSVLLWIVDGSTSQINMIDISGEEYEINKQDFKAENNLDSRTWFTGLHLFLVGFYITKR